LENGIEQIKIDPITGKKLRRGIRLMTIRYKGLKGKVEMPGWYASGSAEGYYSKEDLKVYDRALSRLRTKYAKRG
jgi:HTH-type transcriptional regulator/antitoxin MqsA